MKKSLIKNHNSKIYNIMNELNKKFFIIHIITDTDAVKFQEKMQAYEQNKTILVKQISVSPIQVDLKNGQPIILGVLSSYYEIEASESEFKSWKFGAKLGLKT